MLSNPGILEEKFTFLPRLGKIKRTTAENAFDLPPSDAAGRPIIYTYGQARAAMFEMRTDARVLSQEANQYLKHMEKCALEECVAEQCDALRDQILFDSSASELSRYELARKLFAAVGKSFTPVAKAVLGKIGYCANLGYKWSSDVDWTAEIGGLMSQGISAEKMACVLSVKLYGTPCGQIMYYIKRLL